jgi:hypothetical protein
MIPSRTYADELLLTAGNVIKSRDRTRLLALDALPLAIYATNRSGLLIYFNPACVGLAGRTPTVRRDRWCVTWKLYTEEGEFLPHDRCPMAVAIRTRQPIRGVAAIAERPDRTRVNFLPFPTPLLDHGDEVSIAVNMLIDISNFERRLSMKLSANLTALRGLLVDSALAKFSFEEVRRLVEEIEAQADRPTRDRYN